MEYNCPILVRKKREMCLIPQGPTKWTLVGPDEHVRQSEQISPAGYTERGTSISVFKIAHLEQKDKDDTYCTSIGTSFYTN
jgi:hypothetical protein